MREDLDGTEDVAGEDQPGRDIQRHRHDSDFLDPGSVGGLYGGVVVKDGQDGDEGHIKEQLDHDAGFKESEAGLNGAERGCSVEEGGSSLGGDGDDGAHV